MARPSKKQTATHQRIVRCLDDEQRAVDAVLTHWAGPSSQFDRLSLLTDSAQVEPLDLIAITALGAAIPIKSCAWIVGDVGQWLIAEVLADVPTDVTLCEADVDTIHRVADLFNLLRTEAELTRSATTRLLAVKRPSLVPIDDGALRAKLRYEKADTWWSFWRDAISADVEARVGAIRDAAALHDQAIAALSTMRILDTAVRQK